MFLSRKFGSLFSCIYIDKPPFVILTLLLLIKQEFTGFDCLTRTDGTVVFSSDFICRGGTGGDKTVDAFISKAQKQKIHRIKMFDIYLSMVNHLEHLV